MTHAIETYNQVKQYLGTYSTQEVIDAIERLENGFMVPEVCFLEDSPDREFYDWIDENEEPMPGWYSRLTAPGYLDATDWNGPFETEAEAMAELISLFDEA